MNKHHIYFHTNEVIEQYLKKLAKNKSTTKLFDFLIREFMKNQELQKKFKKKLIEDCNNLSEPHD